MKNTKICFVGNYNDGYGCYSTVIKVGNEFKKIDDGLRWQRVSNHGAWDAACNVCCKDRLRLEAKV